MRTRIVVGWSLVVAAVGAGALWLTARGPVPVERPGAPAEAPLSTRPVAVRPTGPLPAWSGPDLSTPGSAPPVDLLTAPYTLTATGDNRPPRDRPTAYTFTDPPAWEGVAGLHEIPLPFPIPATTHRFAPEGMRVLVDDVPAEFVTVGIARMRGQRTAWTLTPEGALRVAHTGAAHIIHVEHPLLDARLDALDAQAAQARGEDLGPWARRRVVRDGRSRDALLLPAPAQVVWSDLPLPADARFEAVPIMAPTASHPAADGVRLALWIDDGTGPVDLDTVSLVADPARDTPWRVDLRAYAGRTVTLGVRSEPGDNPILDHAALAHPRVVGPASADPRRVIVIGLDTLRPDHLGAYGYPRDTSPHLDRFAASAVTFDRAWTTAPRTRPAFRAAQTGRRPLDAVCAPTLGRVLRDAGFATAGIVANVHLNPRFGFDDGFDLWWLSPAADADMQVDRAIDWLHDHTHDDAYLFLHIMDPHIFYLPPARYRDRFTAGLELLPAGALPDRFNRWRVVSWMNEGALTETMKDHIVARYDAEIAYTDAALGRLFAQLDALPGRTTVIVHSDHGEEFFEHGGFEHNHTLYDETTRGVLLIRPPGGTGVDGARSPAMASLEDIAPTVYALAGLTDTPPSDGVSLVPALRGEAMDPDRAVGVAHLKYDLDRWGVIWRDHKLQLVTATGAWTLHDLAADPGEQRDLSATVDPSPWLERLGAVHGAPVGPGLRVAFRAPPGRVLEITVPTPMRAGGLLHPERVTPHPANRVWGEPMRTPPEAVGTASTSGRTLRIEAGSAGEGIGWVLLDAPTLLADVTATVDGAPFPLDARGEGRGGGVHLHVTSGPLLVPPDDEAERIAACAGGEASVGADDRALLEALGYVGGDDAHGH